MCRNYATVSRLPRSVKPINYKLDFVPNFENFTFIARASVELQVVEPINQIIFHSHGLKISSASYQENQANITYDEGQETVTFEFSTGLPTGKGHLNLEYNGKFAEDMSGLYRSTYKDENGKETNILATQFESIYARRAFPCMDEPDRKATFDISIVALDNQVALSNMPEIARDIVSTPEGCTSPPDGHNYVRITFDRTPIMSTYLVAMVVGEFEYISNHSAAPNSCSVNHGTVPGQIEVRVYTPLGKRNFGQHALVVATKSLEFYAKLFGEPYPMPKLDLIAIPDFACGAMENWGLVTYRETALLIDPVNSSLSSKYSVALTVAHELAHMWFGNLVTMAWWTDLWLNEGFATWAEFLAVDHCFPSYNIWSFYLARECNRALRLDSLRSSHPIEVEVGTVNEVEEIFDEVSYQKGSAIIRMLHHYMGPCLFQAGLRTYIQKFKYSNAKTSDLWAALETTGVSNLTEMMSLWTRNIGYPVLSARLIHAPDGTYSIGLKQRRFLADSSFSETNDEPSVPWRLPVNVCTMDNSSKLLLRKVLNSTQSPPSHGDKHTDTKVTKIDNGEVLYPLPDFTPSEEVRVNPEMIAFCRVDYSPPMLNAIVEGIRKGIVPERDRLCFLDDQFNLARAGLQSTADVLQHCRVFSGEKSAAVWSVLNAGLESIRSLVEEAFYPSKDEVIFPEASKEICGLNKLFIELALPVYEKIGFEPTSADSYNDCLLRPIIIAILGDVGHGEVISKARDAFERHYKVVTSTPAGLDPDPSKLIPPDLRHVVYSICMRNGGDEEFQKLLEIHDRAKLNDERVRVLSSLGATTNAGIIQRLFDLTFTEFVRKQDRFHVLLGVTRSPGGRRALWNLLRSRIATLSEDLATTGLLTRVVKGSVSDFASMERYEEIKAFYEENEVACQRAVKQTLEFVKINADQWRRDGKVVCELLNKLAC